MPRPEKKRDGLATLAPALLDSHYRAIVESSDDAIITKDAEGVITSWNRGAQRLYGYSPQEAVGQPIAILIPSHRRGEEFHILRQILAGEYVDHYETERVTKSGEMLMVSLSASGIRDERGRIVGASVIARDVTEQRRTRRRTERLQRLTAALSRELTPERAVAALLSEAVPALGAAAGTVGLVDEAGEDVELAGSSGYSERGLESWQRFPLDADVPMCDAIRTRQPVWLSGREELLARYPVFDEANIRFGALAVIPLVVEDRSVGALALSFEAPGVVEVADRAFALATAQQAAYALDRARLYLAEREARQRLGFLARASELLSATLDVDATLRELAFLTVPRIADWCSVELADPVERLRNVAVAHADPSKVELARELQRRWPQDPDAPTGAAAVIRSGEPELYPDIPDELLEQTIDDPEQLEAIRELGLVSGMTVPLTARGRTFGALTMASAESGRHFDHSDLELAMDLGRRAAMAVDNSVMYRQEHEAAVTLQRALLPRELPHVGPIELAARYRPAEMSLEVGGDWYDVVESDGGDLTLSVGDVAGHGTQAASVMGQLRTALRAYVSDGHLPPASLERLNRLMVGFDEPQMATVLQLCLDPKSLAFEFVRAGHPPPMLRRPDGEVETLVGHPLPPVGVFPDVSYRAHSAKLEPGMTLLMYTDGLVERRDRTLDAGLARLESALAEAPPDPERCVDHVLDAFRGERSDDDVAVVALRVSP